jgi:hypothetical protein
MNKAAGYGRAKVYLAAGLAAAALSAAPAHAGDDPRIVKIAGYIGDVYGAIGAGIGVINFLAGNPSEVEEAKVEIENLLRAQQHDRLAGEVDGIMTTFNQVVGNPGLDDRNDLLDSVITESNDVRGEIGQIIARRDVQSTYDLAMALGAVSATAAAAQLERGFSQTTVNDFMGRTQQFNYDMIGAQRVFVPLCGDFCDGVFRDDSRDNKVLWPKVADFDHRCNPGPEDGLLLECDPARALCEDLPGTPRLLLPTGVELHSQTGEVVSPSTPACWQESLAAGRNAMNNDPVIRGVERAMQKLFDIGFNVVVENNINVTIVSVTDGSFAAGKLRTAGAPRP